ncbi:MAG: hypothetical protein IJO03_00070 [Clostridia bacterium]|nr:hypothetical protein [Clostridia bacterium]MBQ7120639.1 hypothetical protein [Clostridia bacterium]
MLLVTRSSYFSCASSTDFFADSSSCSACLTAEEYSSPESSPLRRLVSRVC